jgi:hypothetical protein
MRPCGSLFCARRGARTVGWVAGRLLDSGRGYVASLAVAATSVGLEVEREWRIYTSA